MIKKIITTIAIAVCLNTNAQNITTIAGGGTYTVAPWGDGGQAVLSVLANPFGVTLDANGNLYIADYGNNRVRKVNTLGIITTIAGSGTFGYSGDGGQATNASLRYPSSIAIDTHGNIFIADRTNNVIRKVNTLGIISTVAGNGFNAGTGTGGFSGDGAAATAAELYSPYGIACDVHGNLYIADGGNNRIRKVTTLGIISTFAGSGAGDGAAGSYSGDGGQATMATLYQPLGVSFDAVGNLYIADSDNNRIRKVNTTGIISTIAGNVTGGYSGDGGAATAAGLDAPFGINLDANNNLYIADNINNVVRKVNTAGIISTVAGNGFNAGTGSGGYGGDGGSATAAELARISGIAIDALGNLYIADNNNNRVRFVCNSGLNITVSSETICAGATATLTANGANTYTWSSGATGSVISTTPTITTIYTANGTNTTNCTNAGTTTVTVNLLPTLTVTASTNTVCAGSTTTLTASGANTYTWNTNDTGATITPSPTVTSNYTVTGTDGNGCMNMDTLSVIVENCTTSIEQFANNSEVTIYPNPNNGSFVIELNSTAKQTMQMYDVNGKMVLSQTIQPSPNPSKEGTGIAIDASALNEGVYNISLQSNGGVVNKRLVIVR